MTRQLEAIYQGGVFRPLQPVSLAEGQKVVVTIPSLSFVTDGVEDDTILDHEFHRYCESQANLSITLEQVREESASIPGSLADEILVERKERF